MSYLKSPYGMISNLSNPMDPLAMHHRIPGYPSKLIFRKKLLQHHNFFENNLIK
jgi:hypothetical protein